MKVGDSYNPKGLFTGIFIPESMVRLPNNILSLGAKVCFGRLCWHINDREECFPDRAVLAAEIGVSVSSVRDYLKELEERGFIKRVRTGPNANDYDFSWHECLESSIKRTRKDGQPSVHQKNLQMDTPLREDGQPSVKKSSAYNLKEIEVLEGEEEIPPTPSFDADSFLVESSKQPGKIFSGRQKGLIREMWESEWADWPFEKIRAEVDRKLGRLGNSRPIGNGAKVEREPRRSSFVRNEPISKQVIVGRCALFEAYIEIFKLAGKPIGDAEREDAWPMWSTLTEDQKYKTGHDATRLCQETSNPTWIPTPANHLKKKPWTREVIERVLPVPTKELSKHQQAIEIARRKGLM